MHYTGYYDDCPEKMNHGVNEINSHTFTVYDALRLCLGRQVHFAAYRLPGDHPVTMVVQTHPEISPLGEIVDTLPGRGFLIAPFSAAGNHAYLIRPDIIIRGNTGQKEMDILENLPFRPPCLHTAKEPEDTAKPEYLQLILDSIARIRSGAFEKVVLSRVKSLPGNYTARLSAIFESLCEAYPNAFVYLCHVNGQCWTGATPEPFMCARNGELNTVSLAGTMPFRPGNMTLENWNRKEIKEQDYVTRHISGILADFRVTDYNIRGPYVAKAGNLVHLRTDFSFPARAVGNRLPLLIHALHPTPAICGMSTKSALDFILQSEKHNREYYTGLLGPVGIDDLLQLFVNLRCLKVHGNRLVLFVGGGITADSVPEEEWEETEIKAETLLSVIQSIS